ncbi:MAG TPA: DNA/RNA nuclease SfsA [Bauldia sp.]|nr:DNA/RNA nuclease SfsA [Bauldia sp.]
MRFPAPLTPATLIRRYKRFLADVRLASGEVVVVHVANPGAMIGLADPGLPVWLSRSDSKTRTLPWSLELVEVNDGLVGINTAHPNRLVAEAIAAGAIPELAGYEALRREVRYGANSRVDFLLTGAGRPDAYVEVKNVHLLRRPGRAEFPDSVTARGAKHLAELSAMKTAGHRAAMLYLIQRGDAETFELARDLDPAYAAAFDRAKAAGVEMLAYQCRITTEEITVAGALPVLE